jgi:serine/threonine protein kinase/tetratricopeptide (TPR) repeat protein
MKVRELFIEALQKSDDTERRAFLDAACAGDAGLRDRVLRLLAEHAKQESFLLDEPPGVAASTVDLPPSERPGAVIGPYKLVELIGEGGMGSVWLAHQAEPVKRKVALKLIKPGMDSKQVLARFEAERQALALMDHPNIARILDGGLTPDGRPYFVMELVKGVPITQYCDANKLTPRQRLELFVPVCQAVQHAHQKAVIHRDLKPSNVLVALYDDRPVPKVIDFGVAKAIGGALTDQTVETGLGGVVGTPEYMSPEQATLNNLDIDTRSDVYALGVLLYELLTGSPPFSKKELEQKGLLEMLRVVREEEPPRPSTKLSTAEALPTLSANRRTEPRKLMALLRSELDWIVLKALEKDRSRRYETANGLAADINRYLAGEPVLAHPPSRGYRLRKFVKRNKPQVIAGSIVVATLSAGIIGTSLGMVRAEYRRRDADKAREEEGRQRQIALVKQNEAENEKLRAIEFRDKALAALRATTGEDVEKLIGERQSLSSNERAYLEAVVKRWQEFADQEGTDELTRAIRGEGHYNVARLCANLGRRDAARREYEKAQEIQLELVEQFPTSPVYQHDLARTRNGLGIVLGRSGKLSAASGHFKLARDTRLALTDRFPNVPKYREDLAATETNLAIVLADLGQPEAARLLFESALVIFDKLTDEFPKVLAYARGLANTHHNLGILLSDMRQPEKARKAYETARDIRSKIAKQFPDPSQYQQELAGTHHSLGTLLSGLRQQDGARRELEAARDIERSLVDQYPGVLQYQRDLCHTHGALGILLRDLNEKDAALRELAAAVETARTLCGRFPKLSECEQDLARCHNNYGALLLDVRKLDEARSELKAALDIRRRFAELPADTPADQVELGANYCNYAIVMREQGKAADSLEWFGHAIKTLTPVQNRSPRNVIAKLFLRNSHLGRAQSYDALGKHAEATKDWDKAIELSSKGDHPGFRVQRAHSRLRAGMVAEAVAEVGELTAPAAGAPNSPTWNANQLYGFACIYAVASEKIADKKQEYADRAMALVHQAVKAGFNNAGHMKQNTDLASLRDREDFKKLLAQLQAMPVRKP